jgi:hypothetical protein
VFTELAKPDADKCVADFKDLDGAYAAVDGGRHRRAGHAGGCVGHFATLACAGTRRERRAGHVGSAVCKKIATSASSQKAAEGGSDLKEHTGTSASDEISGGEIAAIVICLMLVFGAAIGYVVFTYSTLSQSASKPANLGQKSAYLNMNYETEMEENPLATLKGKKKTAERPDVMTNPAYVVQAPVALDGQSAAETGTAL